MKNISYPGLDATGMDRRTFEKMLRECETDMKTRSEDYLTGCIRGYELSLGIFGRMLRKINPNYEPLEIRVSRNELAERRRKKIEA